MADTSYLDAPLSNGATYFYRIAAVDNSRNRNQSSYTSTTAETQGIPAIGKGPQTPQIDDYHFCWHTDEGLGYPLFFYYDEAEGRGEPYRPVFRIGNVLTVSRPGARMSYTFVVATDPQFKSVVATGSSVAPEDRIIGTEDSWFWARSSMRTQYPADFDTTLMTHVNDSTSWIPSRALPPVADYYWRVRANDGIFSSPWSQARSFSSMAVVELHPGRAAKFDIVLRPEEEAYQVWEKTVSVKLEAFAAEGSPSGIRVTWTIRHDGEVRGVYVLRSTSPDPGSFQRYGDALLPVEGAFIDRMARLGATYYYRLEVAREDGSSEFMGMTSGRLAAPTRFTLGKNRPNPFNPVTQIPYALPDKSEVTLSIYDVTGRLVRRLLDGELQEAGFYQVNLGRDRRGGASGRIGDLHLPARTGSGGRRFPSDALGADGAHSLRECVSSTGPGRPAVGASRSIEPWANGLCPEHQPLEGFLRKGSPSGRLNHHL